MLNVISIDNISSKVPEAWELLGKLLQLCLYLVISMLSLSKETPKILFEQY